MKKQELGKYKAQVFLAAVIALGFVNLGHIFNNSRVIVAGLSDPISSPITPTSAPTATPTATLAPTATPTSIPTATPTNTPTPTPIPFVVTIDNGQAGFSTSGIWKTSTAGAGYLGANYLHDNNSQKGKKKARWTPNLVAGKYNVYVRYVSASNRASNVPYVITHNQGASSVSVNQRINGGQWVSVGTYIFNQGTGGYIEVLTQGTNGYVVADSVLFEQIFN